MPLTCGTEAHTNPMLNRLRAFLDLESRRLFKNSSWVFAANFYSTALAFLRSVLIARGLGAVLFGSYTMVVAFVGLVQEFLNLNLGTALIRFGAGYHTHERNDKLFALVKTCLRVSGIMALVSVSVVALLTYFAYDRVIPQPGLTLYTIAYAAAASVTYFNSISRGMLRLYYKFRISSLIEIVMDTVETLTVGIIVWRFPHQLHAFFPAMIAVRFLNGFICNLIAFYELRSEWKAHADVSPSLIAEDHRPLREFILGNSLGNTLKTMISQGDVLLLGILTGPEQVAYYAVAKKLAYAVLTLTDPLASAIYPQLSKLLAAKQYREVRVMLGKISAFATAPALVALLVMSFLNRWLMVTLYGHEFEPAAGSFMYFFAGALLGAVTFWTLPLVQSLGLVKMRIVAYAVTILVGVSLSWWWLPYFQAQGMAMALLVTNVLNATIFIRLSFRAMHREEHHLSSSAA